MFKAHSKPFSDIVVLELDKATALALHGALIVSAFGQEVADGALLEATEQFLTGRVVEIGTDETPDDGEPEFGSNAWLRRELAGDE
jgi:hypothetical protein